MEFPEVGSSLAYWPRRPVCIIKIFGSCGAFVKCMACMLKTKFKRFERRKLNIIHDAYGLVQL